MQLDEMKALKTLLSCLLSVAFSSHLFAQDIVWLDQKTLSGLGLEGGAGEDDGWAGTVGDTEFL